MTKPGSARTRCRGGCGNGRLPSRGRGGGSCEGRCHSAFLPIPSKKIPGKQAVRAEAKGGRASGLNIRRRQGRAGAPRRGGTYNTLWVTRSAAMSSSSGYRRDVGRDPIMMFHRGDGGGGRSTLQRMGGLFGFF